MNKVLAKILDTPAPKGITTSKVKELIQEVAEIDTNPKLMYSAKGAKILKELDKFGVKDIPQNYRGVLLEHWLELLSQTQETVTQIPEYSDPNLTKTTFNKDESAQLIKEAEEKAKQQAEIREKSKREVEQGLKTKQKIYDLEQQKQRDKQVDDLLTQLFKGKKVVVVPTEEIQTTENPLTTKEKESLITAIKSAKEDPLTAMEVFQERVEKSIKSAPQEVQAIMTKPIIQLSAVKLIEDLKSLPDYKTIGEIPDRPKALNTLSILNPLIDPNSKELIKLIDNEEARVKFAKDLQSEMLALDSERSLKVATTKVVFGSETIAYALYGNETLTNFKISEDPKDRENGVEFDPIEIYKQAKEFRGFFQKIRGVKTVEEVTSASLTYYPTYTYSGASVATKTVSTLTKALPVVSSIYAFKTGLTTQLILKSSPLLIDPRIAGYIGAGGISQSVEMSSLIMTRSTLLMSNSKNIVIGFATGKTTEGGTFIATGLKVGQSGLLAVSTSTGTKIAASGFFAKIVTFVSGLSAPATAGVSLAVGFIVGKITEKVVEKLPQIKKWFQENKEVFVMGGAGIGLVLGGPVVGLVTGGLLMAATGTLAAFAMGGARLLGIIGRNIGITIATPVIVTLLVLPPLVAFIMLVINNSAYVVPPSPLSLNRGGFSSPHVDIKKTPDPSGPFENNELPKTINYTITIKPKKGNLSNVKLTYDCKVISKQNKICPDIEIKDPYKNIFNETLTTLPAGGLTFNYSSTYDPSYQDTAIIDFVQLTGSSDEEPNISAEVSASVTFGSPPISCPVPGAKPLNSMNYSYNRGSDTGHGSTPYWNAMGDPKYRFSLPQSTGCKRPGDCIYYGYAYDVFPTGTTEVFAPTVEGKDVVWACSYAFINKGSGHTYKCISNDGNYLLVLTHLNNNAKTGVVRSGEKIGSLFSMVGNTHLHIEFQLGGRWQKPENYFCQ